MPLTGCDKRLGSAIFQSRGRGTEINPNALGCKGFSWMPRAQRNYGFKALAFVELFSLLL